MNEIKIDYIAARKSKAPSIAFYGYMISEIEKSAVVIEDGVKTYPDVNVVQVLKNLKKKLEEGPSAPMTVEELTIIKKYIPSQLTENQIRVIMEENCAGMNMGERMKYMKENHAGLYDGKLASTIAKEL